MLQHFPPFPLTNFYSKSIAWNHEQIAETLFKRRKNILHKKPNYAPQAILHKHAKSYQWNFRSLRLDIVSHIPTQGRAKFDYVYLDMDEP